MDGREVTQPEERIENAESTERTEEQILEETTHEPGARVEETQEYEEAEAVEGALTEAIEAAEETTVKADLPSESATKFDEPESQAQDPLTGKGYGQQTQEPSEGSEQEEPVMEDTSRGEAETEAQVQTERVTTAETVGQMPSDSEVDPGQIDGYENEPTYEMDDQEPDLGGAIGEGVDKPLESPRQVGPQRIGEGGLPEELLTPQEGPGMQGPKTGSKKKPGMPPGSSSGPPAQGPGSSSTGRSVGEETNTGRYLTLKSMSDGTPGHVDTEDGTWSQNLKTGEWHYYPKDGETAPAEKPQQGDPMDGDQPMPYTGGSTGGGDPDPKEPIGGLDRESARVFPVYGKGTRSDRGGRTPGDKSGDDDSGHFLGDPDLDGSSIDTASPDPGDLDYNEANTLEQELQEKNGRQAE